MTNAAKPEQLDPPTEPNIPAAARRAVAEAIPLDRIHRAIHRDSFAVVGDDTHVEGLIAEAVQVAAPLIVAAELEQLAERFDADAFDGLLGSQTGATLAIVTAEVYEAAAERLRERATELRDGA